MSGLNVMIGFKEAAKMAQEEAELSPDLWLVNLFPKYKTHWWYIPNKMTRNNKQILRLGRDRIVFKIWDPEGYRKEWGKKDITNYTTCKET